VTAKVVSKREPNLFGEEQPTGTVEVAPATLKHVRELARLVEKMLADPTTAANIDTALRNKLEAEVDYILRRTW
jgi:hypothetical protein